MLNWQRVWAVMLKDWKEMLRNPQAIVPVLILPIVLAVVLPVAVILFGSNPTVTASINGMDAFIENLPSGVIPPEFGFSQGVLYAVLVYFFAPIFLMIPVITAMVAASISFAGERERRTLEGLIYSPLTARELVLAKIAVSFVPSLVLSWIAFLLYAMVVNTVGASAFGRMILPTSSWLVLALLLAPAIGFLVVTLVVGVSQTARTVQAAQSVAGFMVIPLLGLGIAQATGFALFDLGLAFSLAAVVIILDFIAISILVYRFDRESLVLKL